MSAKGKYNKSAVIVIASIAATGGLLFGFDTGVIFGALKVKDCLNGRFTHLKMEKP